MTEVQAAIGRYQIKKLHEWSLRRKENLKMIYKTCNNFSALRVPKLECQSCFGCHGDNGCSHAAYRAYVFVNQKRLKKGWNRNRILDEINKKGIPCFEGSCSEVYLEKAFKDNKLKPKKRLLNAKVLGETSIAFLVHPSITKSEIKKTCRIISSVMSYASK